MAGRRLSELLEEQQEPFLLHGAREAPCCSVAEEARRRPLLRRLSVYGSNNGEVARRSALRRAVRRAVRLAGCFSCGARESFFRQLPRAGDTGGSHCDGAVTGFDDGGTRLSPVSVLDVLRYYSDEESHSSPTLSHREEQDDEDDMPSSTSGSSPPSSDLPAPGATSLPFALHTAPDKTCARAAEDATTTRRSEDEQRIIASWERIAGDIARVPALAELDLSSSASAPEWRRLGLREAARVGASIEAMIFDEVRAEAVRDMLEFPL